MSLLLLLDAETDVPQRLPVLTSGVAFGYDPAAPNPVYSDTSSYLLALTTRRGRSYERAVTEAGTAAPVYMNRDRRFDPTFTAGAYYPHVIPMCSARQVATIGTTDYTIHTGFVERWPINWDGPTWGTTDPTIVDATAALAAATITGFMPEESSGDRITRVLSAIAWPPVLGAPTFWTLDTSHLDTETILSYDVPNQTIDAGTQTIQEITIPDESPVSALAHIQEVAQAEAGVFFIDPDGAAIFHDQDHRFAASVVATFSDEPTGDDIQYEDLTVEYDVSKVVNEVSVTSTIASVPTTETAYDYDSQARYLRRATTLALPLTSSGDLTARAELEVSLFAQPQLRFTRLVVRPAGQPEVWETVLALEISDKITVERTPRSALIPDETITRNCFIESIEHNVSDVDWTVTFGLSPADAYE